MDWERYNGNNPAIEGNGFWASVPYRSSSLECPIKGFFNIDGQHVNAIGQVWFPPEKVEFSYYLFDRSGSLYSQHETNRIVTKLEDKIDPDLFERLAGLAMDFRAKFPEYRKSLDSCMRDMQRVTRKR